MDDAAFLSAFEDATLPADDLTHRAHVRMCWLYLTQHGRDVGTVRLEGALMRYVAAVGAADKYHVTLTRLWIHLVHHAIQHGVHAGFDAFLVAHPDLSQSRFVFRFYSEALLWSDAARAGFGPGPAAPARLKTGTSSSGPNERMRLP